MGRSRKRRSRDRSDDRFDRKFGTRRRETARGHASGRDAPAKHPGLTAHRVLLLLSLLTLLPLCLVFEPVGWWPFSFVALVPWLMLVGGSQLAPRVYAYSYLVGLAFFLINMHWLQPPTAMTVPHLPFRVGWGYLAASAYLACYFPLVAIVLRHAVRRRRWPMALVLPIVWTACEMIRAVMVTGFPWFFLSHTMHAVLPLIQISDLTGAYGVTFVIAAVSGAIADWLFARPSLRGAAGLPAPSRSPRGSLVFAGCLLAATLIYGFIQRGRNTTSEGPRIAVLQGDFPNVVYRQDARDEDLPSEPEKMEVYLSMIDEAAKQGPDLIMLPESPWAMLLNPEERDVWPLSRVSFEQLQARATRYNAQILTGSGTWIRTPNDLLAAERRYNSATVFDPQGGEPQRYDKIHLVIFGEYIPFRFGKLRFLYFWLNRLMPFSGPDGTFEYSFFPGRAFRRFSLEAPSLQHKRFRYAVPICYEDVMPYISREFTFGGSNVKQVDFLLNISNDGWFGRGTQQPQHLAISVFRAVENRVGIARAVNTGVSAMIDPDGRVHHVIKGDPANPWPGICGYTVARIKVDSRFTFYSRYGDWFGWGCALLWLAIFIDYWVARARALETASAGA
ncbi:MAG: apolipoprotein N-acyltransferase [Phycisphaerae bacterium]